MLKITFPNDSLFFCNELMNEITQMTQCVKDITIIPLFVLSTLRVCIRTFRFSHALFELNRGEFRVDLMENYT